nr:LOW QUALITY PROTEIN: nuclear factor of activated T-cells 5-like [Cherax quadricarinatus]
MGKVSNRSSMVSTRRRLIKASSGVGVKKCRGSAKGSLPPPPPPQSLVLDEDSGFGGDQSLDSESSLLSSPGSSSGVASLPSVLPSLTMVPKAKLLLVSLLQGAGGVQGTGTSQKTSGNIAVGAYPPTTQASISNGTNQTGNTHGAVMSSGAENEGESSQSVWPLLAAASLSLQGAPGTDVLSELPAASTSSPSNCPTEPVTQIGHKVVENKVNTYDKNLHVDLGGEEAQELPASRGTTKIHSIPPLVSFRDVSLLSSLNPFQRSRGTCRASLLCVDGPPQPCGHSNKILKSSTPHTHLPLNSELSPCSSDGTMELKLLSQPEEQHRARYQTEGSRGAVKDRAGIGHPTVKLIGYNKSTVVQVFVGCDSEKIGPHMFYQVCRVSGKNSTPCKERRLDGTALIEASLNPETDMTMSCDCVGILKERNVDVEHRFKAAVSRGRKKSTKCRLVFRTFVTLSDGTRETLQVVSQPIACTQPPGVPEICRKSLSKCSVTGGEEMFIFGKNFLKDTLVIFQQNGTKSQPIWEEKVAPDKETLQSIHLIVMVPKYYDQSITEEVTVDVMVSSGGKTSESHSLTYVPLVIKKEDRKQIGLEKENRRQTFVANAELPLANKQEKRLPKGVSPCALQLNRHYAETGTLLGHLPEVTDSSATPTTSTTTPVFTSTAAAAPLLESPLSNSTLKKRASIRAPRSALRSSKTLLPSQSTTSSWSRMSNASASSVSDAHNEGTGKRQEKQGNAQGIQGTVSLESLVEILKVIQKFPAGSNIHTSVLQLAEELVKSMKKNISSPCKIEIGGLMDKQDVVQPMFPERVVSNVPASNIPSGSYNTKTQDLVPHTISLHSQTQPHETFTDGNHSNNVVLPVATTVSLFPFTFVSAMPSTVSAGSRVARVAPVVPVAPTTTVSSPELTRTVSVCVDPADILEGPSLKKHCGNALPMDYQLLRSNHFGSEPVLSSSISDTVVTQTPVSTSFNTVAPMLPPKVVSNQHSSDHTSAVDTESCRLDISTSRIINSQHLTETSVDAPVYQPISQPVIHNIGQDTTHVAQSLRTNQPVTQTVPHTNLVTTHQTSQTISHTSTQGNIIDQHTNQQTMTVQSTLPATDSDPLLSQSAGLCPLLANVAVTTTSQAILPSSSMTTSALTRSDPLLSQSSPVAPIHIEANTSASIVRNEPGNARSRGDPLMVPNPTVSQVSMQNEVTSAINLSESELLNYFDPNCFDNV